MNCYEITVDTGGKGRQEILLAEDVESALADLRAFTLSSDLPVLSIVTIGRDVVIGPMARRDIASPGLRKYEASKAE